MYKNLLSFIFISISWLIQAQNLPNIIPPSPNASSLGKYGEFPISLYTGTPNINIPITELSSGSLKFPVSLSYHASGIKVEEMASWVGLGWTLNTGGIISRTVRGKADTHQKGFFNTQTEFTFPPSASDINFMKAAASGDWDSEPDVYFFNFLGYSGKFFLEKKSDGSYEAHLMPKKDIKIIPPQALGSLEGGEWTVITESGVKLIFGGTGFTEQSNSTNMTTWENEPDYISSWYLKEIVSADGTDHITISYTAENLSYGIKSSETDYVLETLNTFCQNRPAVKTYNRMQVQVLFPVEVNVNGKLAIEFSREERTDILKADQTNSSRLKSIELYDYLADQTIPKEERLLKSYSFGYDYYAKNQHCDWVSNLWGDNPAHRLKLESLTENSSDYTDKKVHGFTYYEGLPSKCSYSQDYWGYYNGASNATLLPKLEGYETRDHADRDANPDVVMAGTLHKITYPSGGYTIFNFEAHENNDLVEIAEEPKSVKFVHYDLEDPNFTDSKSFHIDYDQEVVLDYLMTNDDVNEEQGGFSMLWINDAEGNPVGVQCSNHSVLFNHLEYSWSYAGRHRHIFQLPAGDYTFEMRNDVAGTDFYAKLSYNEKHENGVAKTETQNINGLIAGKSAAAIPFYIGQDHQVTIRYDLPLNQTITTTAKLEVFKDDIKIHEVIGIDSKGLFNFQLDLTKGDHSILVTNTGANDLQYMNVHVDYTHWNFERSYIGGLRIKNMETHDGLGNPPMIKNFIYEGIHEMTPIVDGNYTFGETTVVLADCDGINKIGFDCEYKVRTSQSSAILGSTQGSPVGYRKVTTKFNNESSHGRIVDEFTSVRNIGGGAFPFPQPTNIQWRSGLLKRQTVYSGDIPEKKRVVKENHYTFIPLAEQRGYKAKYTYKHPCEFTGDASVDKFTHLFITSMLSEWVQHISSTETVYDLEDETKYTVTHTENVYDEEKRHTNVVEVISTDSKGNRIKTINKYPHDFVEEVSDRGDIAQKMVFKNIVTPVFENIVSKRQGNQDIILSKTRSTYNEYDITGVDENAFYIEKVSIAPNPNDSDVFEDRLTYHYNGHGDIVGNTKVNDISIAYIWDENHQYPIAKIDNALASEVFYQGFEESEGQEVVGLKAFTGLKVRPGSSYTISDIAPATGLKLSYWYNKDGNWIFSGELDYTNATITIDGNYFDEIRVYPAGAQMATFAYKAMQGLVSTCDANNNVVYYEYDSFFRLKAVRDVDNNILKAYDYELYNNIYSRIISNDCVENGQDLNVQLEDIQNILDDAQIDWYIDDVLIMPNQQISNTEVVFTMNNSGKQTLKAVINKSGYLEVAFKKHISVLPIVTIEIDPISIPSSYDIDPDQIMSSKYSFDGVEVPSLIGDFRMGRVWEFRYDTGSDWEKFEGILVPDYDKLYFRLKVISECGTIYYSNTVEFQEDVVGGLSVTISTSTNDITSCTLSAESIFDVNITPAGTEVTKTWQFSYDNVSWSPFIGNIDTNQAVVYFKLKIVADANNQATAESNVISIPVAGGTCDDGSN